MTSFTKSSAELQHGPGISVSESAALALFFPASPNGLPLCVWSHCLLVNLAYT